MIVKNKPIPYSHIEENPKKKMPWKANLHKPVKLNLKKT